MSSRERCQYLLDMPWGALSQCPNRARWAVSVRHRWPLDDDWVRYGVCGDGHLVSLVADLAAIFDVTEAYAVDDVDARALCERLAS